MRLYLQTPPASTEAPRYVQIVLEQDLLGGWTLYRETGTQGGKATLKREQYLEREAAIAATVDCGVTFPYSLASGGTLSCTYQTALPNGDNRTNTATATR